MNQGIDKDLEQYIMSMKGQRKNFTNEQIRYLIKLINTFGKDYEYASYILRRKYKNDYLVPSICKVFYQKYSKTFNWDSLNKLEMEESYLKFKEGIKHERQRIWAKITQNQDRPEYSFKSRFLMAIKKMIRYLIFCYSGEEDKPIYVQRMMLINTLGFGIIIYLSMYKPSDYDKESIIFRLIYDSCRKLIKWIEAMITLEVYSLEDYKFYFNTNALQKHPQISCYEFNQTIERILLLDTINRVMMSQKPYSDHYGNRKPKVNYNESDDQRQSQESNDEKIPDRPYYVPYDILRKQVNRHSKPFNGDNSSYKGYRLFVKLNKKQRQLIQRSDVASRLLHIQCKISNILAR